MSQMPNYVRPKSDYHIVATILVLVFDSSSRRKFNIQEGHDGPGSLTRVIFPTTEFYIFVPLVPTCDPQGGASFDPKGHHMNKIDKSLQGDATNQNSKLYPVQCQIKRILKLVFFVPMFQLVTPLWDQF